MEKNRHDFRKGIGSSLGASESLSRSVPLAPLDVHRAALLNHHGYTPAVRGEVSPVQGDVSRMVKDV